MPELRFIPKSEFDRVRLAVSDKYRRVQLLANMCRVNTLVAVKRAGSGHLGSSFSAMDVVAWLYFEVLDSAGRNLESPDRDIFFSSKGHDVPGLYAVLHALGILDAGMLFRLRRLHGLDGHPDVRVPGCESNTGSLGMGLSKARGMCFAKRRQGRGGRIYVMLGDGELQEGQIWEAAQTAAHHGARITAIVDHNKIQTDLPVEDVISLGRLAEKFQAFGWTVDRCDGHDCGAIHGALQGLGTAPGPALLIADTIKGRGVSFMEEISQQPSALGKYRWHSGAPDDEAFLAGFEELTGRINEHLIDTNLDLLSFDVVPKEARRSGAASKEYVADGYGRALVRLGHSHPQLIVLDGDLAADCRVRAFQDQFPGQFIENGIAEQDMVSVAGGIARHGGLPVCNSFASFLCARANEQIYNNACEGTKIVYATHFGGMIPAGPGKSHQSVRDIGLMASIPSMVVVQPASAAEADSITEWAITSSTENVSLRLNIGPSPGIIPNPLRAPLKPGRGSWLRPGTDAVMVGYGAVMLHEALGATELLERVGFSLGVVNHPWLNRFDKKWIAEVIDGQKTVFTLDDHLVSGGMGERLAAFLAREGMIGTRAIALFGLEELPECGTPWEVLRFHQLDARSLARRVLATVGRDSESISDVEGGFDTLEAAQ